MTAAEALGQYRDMLIADVHHMDSGTVLLELCVPGHRPRTWVTVSGVAGELVVNEAVDAPASRYRNRRGYTADLAQHHIDQGDDRAERDRELNDDRYDVT